MKNNDITLTFFPIGIECVKDCFIAALEKEYKVQSIVEHKGILEDYYIQQYNAPRVQYILYAPKSNPHTTVMFANIMDGYARLTQFVSKKYGLEYYNVRISDGTSQMAEAYHFHYYSPSRVRHLLCYQDPQWEFYEEGEPLEFEDVELYKSRLKKNRLNREIILQYLKRLGWDIMNENFWRTENVVYEFVQTDIA